MPSPFGEGGPLTMGEVFPLPASLTLGHLPQRGRLLEIPNLRRLQLKLELIRDKGDKL